MNYLVHLTEEEVAKTQVALARDADVSVQEVKSLLSNIAAWDFDQVDGWYDVPETTGNNTYELIRKLVNTSVAVVTPDVDWTVPVIFMVDEMNLQLKTSLAPHILLTLLKTDEERSIEAAVAV